MFISVIRENEIFISVIRDSLFFLFVNRATDPPLYDPLRLPTSAHQCPPTISFISRLDRTGTEQGAMSMSSSLDDRGGGFRPKLIVFDLGKLRVI